MKKEIKMRHEVLWDYDWILYNEYTDWTKKNVHTGTYFAHTKTKEEYWLVYQYNEEYQLVGYSIYRAKWLKLDDDLNAPENQLWGTRWKDWRWEMVFIPVKDMSYLHIKAILKDYEDWRLNIVPRYLAYFKSIIEIEWKMKKEKTGSIVET